MGLVLDTSLLIQAERLGLSLPEALERWSVAIDMSQVGISVVSLAELGHGIARAKPEWRRKAREEFVEALRRSIPAFPITEAISLRAGMIDGELQDRGFDIGPMDSFIAATALERGDGVATLNGKHFKAVPGLEVVEL
jgi:predicted nucleic acid-binding protein